MNINQRSMIYGFAVPYLLGHILLLSIVKKIAQSA